MRSQHPLLTFEDAGELSWQQLKACADLMVAYTASFDNVEGYPTIYWDTELKRAVLELDDRRFVAGHGELNEIFDCTCGTTVTDDEWHRDSQCCEVCYDRVQQSYSRKVG